MYIYAQHGYGKSDKIETGIRDGHLSGVILSPRDEDQTRMADFVNTLRQEFSDRITILFDPQFYVTTLSPVRDGYLPDYPYYRSGLTRAQYIAQRDIHHYVEDTLRYQMSLGLDRLVSPSVYFTGFRDPWSQIALSMAQESIIVHAGISGAPALLLSFVFDENSLLDLDAINEFLDIISIWEVPGYYLLINRRDLNYPALLDEVSLVNLVYLVYVLAEINGFEVICGYSDLVGILLHAVGATGTGTGWFHSLRQFSLSRFLPATGGRPARSRYTSGPLLNSIYVVPELETIYQLGLTNHVLSNTAYDNVMSSRNPANASWPSSISCLHHWQVLAQIADEVSSQGSLVQRLTFLEDVIQRGTATYNLLERTGVPFDAVTGPRDLQIWHRAIRSFRGEAGI